MENTCLNYNYRFPRVFFKNGEAKYGRLFSYYNKVKKKLEYYFADANTIRKHNLNNTLQAISFLKSLKFSVNPMDIEKVEYEV